MEAASLKVKRKLYSSTVNGFGPIERLDRLSKFRSNNFCFHLLVAEVRNVYRISLRLDTIVFWAWMSMIAGDSECKTSKVYICIDNSNLLHQGQRALPNILKLPADNDIVRDMAFHYPSLVNSILQDRELGGPCVLVTSTPSPVLEPEWDLLPEEMFRVLKFPRNSENKEKGNDVALAVEATEIIFSSPPSVLALVLGDGDYVHLVNKAINNNWDVELYFWPNSESIAYFKCLDYVLNTTPIRPAGLSTRLQGISNVKLMNTLADECDKFVYIYTESGASSGAYSFDVAHDTIKSLDRHTHIFKITSQFGTFGWWTFLSQNTLRFMFKSRSCMKNAINALSKIRPEWEIYENSTIVSGKRKKSSSWSQSSISQKSRSSLQL